MLRNLGKEEAEKAPATKAEEAEEAEKAPATKAEKPGIHREQKSAVGKRNLFEKKGGFLAFEKVLLETLHILPMRVPETGQPVRRLISAGLSIALKENACCSSKCSCG